MCERIPVYAPRGQSKWKGNKRVKTICEVCLKVRFVFGMHFLSNFPFRPQTPRRMGRAAVSPVQVFGIGLKVCYTPTNDHRN